LARRQPEVQLAEPARKVAFGQRPTLRHVEMLRPRRPKKGPGRRGQSEAVRLVVRGARRLLMVLVDSTASKSSSMHHIHRERSGRSISFSQRFGPAIPPPPRTRHSKRKKHT
jgi:hypothetical protein